MGEEGKIIEEERMPLSGCTRQ